MKKALFFLTVVLVVGSFQISANQTAQSEDGPAKLEVKDQMPSPDLKEFTHPRADESKLVEASPVVRGAEEKKILEALREAKRAGDIETASALQARLDEVYGLPASISLPAVKQGQDQVRFKEPSEEPPLRWAGDVLITYPTSHQVKPSMASAPNGDLYVAVEDLSYGQIDVCRSTDGGESWSYVVGFSITPGGVCNPSLTYAEGNEKWVYVAYEVTYTDDSKGVRVFRFDPDNTSNYDFATIQSGIYMLNPDDHIYPEICTDYLIYPYYYVYVTYAVYAIDYYPVMFSRSTDFGLTWQEPQNLTGGAENSMFQTRPDIAYGTSGLFVAFEKLGWTGSSWDNQIWVTKSTTYGTAWDTPLQLTDNSDEEYHPRVAAAVDNSSVVVAYTRNYLVSRFRNSANYFGILSLTISKNLKLRS